MHTLAFANPKTNTFYFVIFEAPKTVWEEVWRKGQLKVKLLYLDDEI